MKTGKRIMLTASAFVLGALLLGCSGRTEELRELMERPVQAEEVYTPASYQNYSEALAAAGELVEERFPDSEQIDEACAALEEAIGGLLLRPDKSALQEKVDEASDVNLEEYTTATAQSLKAAAERAGEVLLDENALEEDVSSAIAELDDALAGLMLRADKTALEALIQQAEGYEEEEYTTSSFAILKSALVSARYAAEEEDIQQSEVSWAEANLREAIDGLAVCTKGVFRITVRFSNVSNDHVGNTWSYEALYNGENADGMEITASFGENITISCRVEESDNSPDVGTGKLTVTLEDGAEASVAITVRENRGRYSGHTAVWSATAEVTLTERV